MFLETETGVPRPPKTLSFVVTHVSGLFQNDGPLLTYCMWHSLGNKK